MLAASATLAAFGRVTLAQPIRKANDIVSQVANLKVRGDPMGFRVPVNSLILGGPNHWQGIVRHPDPDKPYFYAVSSRPSCTELHVIRIGTSDSKSGYRMRSNRLDPSAQAIATGVDAADRVVNTIPLPDTHAGGMQAAGKYLAIPMCMHDDNCVPPELQYEKIGIYDISDPANPVLARMIVDAPQIPGGMAELAFAQRDDGTYFLLGAYSNQLWHWTLSADLTNFSLRGQVIVPPEIWTGNGNGDAFQSYQLINPLGEVQADGTEIMYLLALHNTSPAGVLQDEVWLYRLVLSSGGTVTNFQRVSVTQVSSRTSADSSQINANWSAGGSAWVSPTGGLLLYGCEHNISGLNYSVTMSEYSDRSGDSPAIVPTDGCTAQVFLYTDPNFDGKVLTVDALDRERKNYNNLLLNHEGAGGFSNNVSSITWRLPSGCVLYLFGGTGQTGNYLALSGAGSYSDLANVNWTVGNGNCNDKIQSLAFTGASTPGAARLLEPTVSAALNLYIDSLPCALLKLGQGDYSGPTILNRPVEIRATDGLVRIGTP